MIVPGFKFAATAAAIKKPGVLDLALMVADTPAAAAGVYTLNRVKAAPVLITQARLRKGVAQAILVNAGNANACNGPRGLADRPGHLPGGRQVAQYPGAPGAAVVHRGHRRAPARGPDHPGPAPVGGRAAP